MSITVSLKDVCKSYGRNQVVKNFFLNIEDKEFIVLVGPSGCGKSTTLRMIAGLEEITQGSLVICNEPMNLVSPGKRGVAMVFQDYALYPHMNVYENMAFGLTLNKKLDKVEIENRIKDAATILDLSDYLKRRPAELSGGQRQRVAMGRALVKKARVFLFDEPLSNLDAKLRSKMRGEIKKFHMMTQATTIYVTHDQLEAMTLADRIVVMNEGKIEQAGTPTEVFNQPRSVFVATFIGNPAMNIFKLKVVLKDQRSWLESFDGSIVLPLPADKTRVLKEGQTVLMGLRPHEIFPQKNVDVSDEEAFANVELVELLGKNAYVSCRTGNHEFKIEVMGEDIPLINQQIRLRFNMNAIHLFDFETGLNLIYGER